MGAEGNKENEEAKSGSITVRLGEPAAANLSPLAFHGLSKRYFLASKLLEEEQDNYYPVPYFLLCKAIELALKAFLLTKGISKKKLKKRYGHNLMRTLGRAQNEGLAQRYTISSQGVKALEKANDYYCNKDFEYFELRTLIKAMHGYPDLPDLDVLYHLAEKLIENLEQVCWDAS